MADPKARGGEKISPSDSAGLPSFHQLAQEAKMVEHEALPTVRRQLDYAGTSYDGSFGENEFEQISFFEAGGQARRIDAAVVHTGSRLQAPSLPHIELKIQKPESKEEHLLREFSEAQHEEEKPKPQGLASALGALNFPGNPFSKKAAVKKTEPSPSLQSPAPSSDSISPPQIPKPTARIFPGQNAGQSGPEETISPPAAPQAPRMPWQKPSSAPPPAEPSQSPSERLMARVQSPPDSGNPDSLSAPLISYPRQGQSGMPPIRGQYGAPAAPPQIPPQDAPIVEPSGMQESLPAPPPNSGKFSFSQRTAAKLAPRPAAPATSQPANADAAETPAPKPREDPYRMPPPPLQPAAGGAMQIRPMSSLEVHKDMPKPRAPLPIARQYDEDAQTAEGGDEAASEMQGGEIEPMQQDAKSEDESASQRLIRKFRAMPDLASIRRKMAVAPSDDSGEADPASSEDSGAQKAESEKAENDDPDYEDEIEPKSDAQDSMDSDSEAKPEEGSGDEEDSEKQTEGESKPEDEGSIDDEGAAETSEDAEKETIEEANSEDGGDDEGESEKPADETEDEGSEEKEAALPSRKKPKIAPIAKKGKPARANPDGAPLIVPLENAAEQSADEPPQDGEGAEPPEEDEGEPPMKILPKLSAKKAQVASPSRVAKKASRAMPKKPPPAKPVATQKLRGKKQSASVRPTPPPAMPANKGKAAKAPKSAAQAAPKEKSAPVPSPTRAPAPPAKSGIAGKKPLPPGSNVRFPTPKPGSASPAYSPPKPRQEPEGEKQLQHPAYPLPPGVHRIFPNRQSVEAARSEAPIQEQPPSASTPEQKIEVSAIRRGGRVFPSRSTPNDGPLGMQPQSSSGRVFPGRRASAPNQSYKPDSEEALSPDSANAPPDSDSIMPAPDAAQPESEVPRKPAPLPPSGQSPKPSAPAAPIPPRATAPGAIKSPAAASQSGAMPSAPPAEDARAPKISSVKSEILAVSAPVLGVKQTHEEKAEGAAVIADELYFAYAREKAKWLYDIYKMGGMTMDEFRAQVKAIMSGATESDSADAKTAKDNQAFHKLNKELEKKFRK